MGYLDEIETARNTYYKAMASAKEIWVNSNNNWISNDVYNKTIATATKTYDDSIKSINYKYFNKENK